MTTLIAIQVKSTTDVYKDVKGYPIAGSSADFALAAAMMVFDSGSTQTRQLTSSDIAGLAGAAQVILASDQIATTDAAVLPTQTGIRVKFQADPNNEDDIYIGNVDAQPFVLTPGSTMWDDITNLNAYYISCVGGVPVLNFLVYA